MSTPDPRPTDARTRWLRWARAASTPQVDHAIRTLYAQLDQAVASQGPTCWTSGRCCKFDSFGHRLYVTGLEIAWVLAQPQTRSRSAQAGPAPPPSHPAAGEARCLPLPQARVASAISASPPASQRDPQPQPLAAVDGCIYQIEGLCSIHAVRPMGCRIFFCEKGAERWQQDVYERFLDQLRQLHTRCGLDYHYMEWRAGLDDALTAGLPACAPDLHDDGPARPLTPER